MKDPIFSDGDVIEPIYTSGYNIKGGNKYIVLAYEASFATPHYIFPAYVQFADDAGRICWAHARRFRKVES